MSNAKNRSFHGTKALKGKIFALIFFCLMLLVLNKFREHLVIIASLVVCVASMQYKRYMSIVIGIDFCLAFTMLASSRYGAIAGMLIGGLSFFLGMLFSLEFSKSPMVTIYGTLFYALIGLVYALVPTSLIYSLPLINILLANLAFATGAFFIGAPIQFLLRYLGTNTIANLLFIQIFASVLKLVF